MYIVTLEGLDGSGKSTVCNMLKDYLLKKGFDTVVLSDLYSTDFGLEVNRLFKSSEYIPDTKRDVCLLLAARRNLIVEKLTLLRDTNTIVIMDRYHLSTLAYQDMEDGYPSEQLLMLVATSMDGYYPNLSIYLDIDYKTSQDRLSSKEKDVIEKRSEDYFNEVRNNYLAYCAALGKEEYNNGRDIKIVDAKDNLDVVFNKVTTIISTYLIKWNLFKQV